MILSRQNTQADRETDLYASVKNILYLSLSIKEQFNNPRSVTYWLLNFILNLL